MIVPPSIVDLLAKLKACIMKCYFKCIMTSWNKYHEVACKLDCIPKCLPPWDTSQ